MWLLLRTVSAYPADDYADDGVAPGVTVVAGTDYPVFYNDSLYWAYFNGFWYSSTFCCGGWAVGRPPAVIVGIRNPGRFANFHGYSPL